jgi:hypothetical protein
VTAAPFSLYREPLTRWTGDNDVKPATGELQESFCLDLTDIGFEYDRVRLVRAKRRDRVRVVLDRERHLVAPSAAETLREPASACIQIQNPERALHVGPPCSPRATVRARIPGTCSLQRLGFLLGRLAKHVGAGAHAGRARRFAV